MMDNSSIAIPDDMEVTSGDGDGKIISDNALFYLKAIFDAILTQFFCIFGTVTNIINIVVFRRIGFSETINISLTALAVSDLGSCFILIWRNLVFTPWFSDLSLPFEPNEISFLISLWPHNMFISATKFFTAFICVERCLCVMVPLKVKSIVTKKRVKIYCIFSYIFSVLPFIPLYFTHGYDWKFSAYRNKTLVGLILTSNAAEMNAIVYPILNVVYSIFPFVVITVATIFLVVSLQKNSKWRQKAMSASNSSNTSKNENRISKMVVMISTVFIGCFCPYAVALVVQSLYPELSIAGKYRNAWKMMGSVVFFFECVNSSCNIFIYFINSTIYRNMFKQIFFSKKDKAQEK